MTTTDKDHEPLISDGVSLLSLSLVDDEELGHPTIPQKLRLKLQQSRVVVLPKEVWEIMFQCTTLSDGDLGQQELTRFTVGTAASYMLRSCPARLVRSAGPIYTF